MPVDKVMPNNPFAKIQQVQQKQNQTAEIQKTSAEANVLKKSKTPMIVAGATLAAVCGVVYWKREALGLTKAAAKNAKGGVEKLQEKIVKLKEQFKSKAQEVLKENTVNGMVKLESIEPAAAMRSASKTEHEPFHQAASWIEEAYIDAYSRAQLSDGNNILNYIYKRIGSEDNTLAQMYAQMPKQEAEIRIKQFVSEAVKKDTHNGMTPEKFIKDMWDNFIPNAKQELEALK